MEQNNNNDVWIYHYGVKGMKWGVRRQIAARSKAGATLGKDIRRLDKKIRKLENRKKTKGLSISQEERLREKKGARNTLNRAKKQYTKGLSDKDIRRGERAVRALDILNLGSGGGVRTAVELGYSSRADKAIGKSSKKRTEELIRARRTANKWR